MTRSNIDNLPVPRRILQRLLPIFLMLVLFVACSGGGGSGGSGNPAMNDRYMVSQSGGTLLVAAPGVLANDSGNTLSSELAAPPVHNSGPFTLNSDGSFVYKNNGTGTTDSFTYRLRSGGSVVGTATVTLTINQPPIANNACLSTPADTSTPVARLPGTDPEGGALTFQILTQPTKGSLSVDVAGNYVYMPTSRTPPFLGMDKFTYQATDAYGLKSTGTVWVLINSKVRIMPLGDSITAGIYTADLPAPNQRIGYRGPLFNELETLSPSWAIDFVGTLPFGGALMPDPDQEGHPGMCADNTGDPNCAPGAKYDNLVDKITSWLNANPPDIILLHIGTNDANRTSWANIQNNLNLIDSWETSNYPVTVFLARIIPSVDGTLLIDKLNNDVAAHLPAWLTTHPNTRVIMVDQQSLFETATDPNKANPSLMTAGDNLHPNATGYNVMANKWKTDMLSAGALPNCP